MKTWLLLPTCPSGFSPAWLLFPAPLPSTSRFSLTLELEKEPAPPGSSGGVLMKTDPALFAYEL